MSDLKAQFEQASVDVHKLPKRPDNNSMLKIYSLFKQGTVGDVSGSRPGMLDIKGRAKYDAWAKLQGTSTEQAMTDYIAFVDSLR